MTRKIAHTLDTDEFLKVIFSTKDKQECENRAISSFDGKHLDETLFQSFVQQYVSRFCSIFVVRWRKLGWYIIPWGVLSRVLYGGRVFAENVVGLGLL